MTRRIRIETLERRQMYAAHPFMDYTDDDAVSVAAGDVNGDGVAEIVVASNAAASVKSPRDAATGQAHGLVGDFNNDGRDDVAELFGSHPDLNRAGFYDLLVSSVMSGIDVWEHASVQHGPEANGIIAVLIGLVQATDGTSNTMMLAVDPSDASGNTFIRVDTRNMKAMAASLLASDEFFSRFAGTTFDDEAAAVVAGRSGKVAQVTHDREFENWASVKGFDRGYLPPAGNSILHEENEFSFPRMIRGV